MSKICTTIEQSKKLIELGIGRTTSDMYYWCGSDLRIGGYKAQDEETDIPAWSLSALFKWIRQFHQYKLTYINSELKNNTTITLKIYDSSYHQLQHALRLCGIEKEIIL